MNHATFYQNIKDLLKKARLKEAIQQFEALAKQLEYGGFSRLATLYIQRYNNNQKEAHRGVLTQEVVQVNNNRLSITPDCHGNRIKNLAMFVNSSRAGWPVKKLFEQSEFFLTSVFCFFFGQCKKEEHHICCIAKIIFMRLP